MYSTVNNIIQLIFDVPLCPELVQLITSNLNCVDYTMLYFVNKPLRCSVMSVYKTHPLRNPIIYNEVIKYGYFAILKWITDYGCKPNAYSCDFAAFRGHLEILMWLRSNYNSQWSSVTWQLAQQNGHYEIVKWAIANGCPENDRRIYPG